MNTKNTISNKTNSLLAYQNVLEAGMKLINLYNKAESLPRNYGTDEVYYSLEIHTIHIIGKHSEVNVTEIASHLGISKSAVTKVLAKLEKKEAVYKYKREDNKKEVLVRLTQKGKQAYEGHIEYHIKYQDALFKRLDQLPASKIESFLEVISVLNEFSAKNI